MSNLVTANSNAIESALVQGDLSKLSVDQRLSYYKQVCDSLGLNPLTKPFDYITLNGKLTLYAKRDAADQLRKVHGVSITITAREKIDDLFIVTAKAKDKSGREDESTGAVNIAGLKGDALANAFLKAETKAKRRVTLSICGLGMLDETEVETIPDAKKEVTRSVAKEVSQVALHESNTPYPSPFADPGSQVQDYVCTFGKFKGLKVSDIEPVDLGQYVAYIYDDSKKKGKEIRGQVKEFLDAAEGFLASLAVSYEASQSETIPF